MYESYYGLSAKPFQLTPDPSFFFASKWHQRALAYLQYGLSQAEGFIVITGDIGTGKTTIANSLLADIEDDIVAVQIVTPRLNPDELVKMVAAKFHIATENRSKSEVLQALEQYLRELHGRNSRALLIVDEAQNLPLETIEELRMLSNFQQSGKPLLQSFLLGQKELQPILRAPNMDQFRQRIVASCHLKPLSLEETTEYIGFRLAQAGWHDKPPISDDAFSIIHDFTLGIPRKINTFMDRAFLFGFLEDEKELTAEIIKAVIDEVREEMFEPEMETEFKLDEHEKGSPTPLVTPNGQVVKDAEYYKSMLTELVDALDDAIRHKVKLTQYMDKLLKKKYKTYVRMKSNGTADMASSPEDDLASSDNAEEDSLSRD
ncbi:AAA family ATPase [Alteromonas sp. 345S023]|uniref:AAA family ATPase n=1 Tax=Alteromonas profundi TaxID=2696062 RepID=A0A7X5LL74_9ALTE|nr:XrtA/PEP-CTERM system-associated ATPase [Alteromonas profundi]NDV91391.1 AAA family ATPase [Alteromonas profundi]